ncbi:MocR-like pyridoxine biosynthesis transcription factor PdxR [Humibacter soli]
MRNDWANSGLDLHLAIDPRRKAASLEDAVRTAIRDGRLATGTRLPASRSLARDLGIARNSVAEAYSRLVAEGWLEARVGSGTSVVDRTFAPAAETRPPAERTFRLDLRGGIPDISGFPRAAWAAAVRTALANAPAPTLGYQDPRGVEVARAALAAYLARARGVWASPDQLVITPGFGGALGLVTRALARRGARRIAVEEYGHALHREILSDAGLLPVSLSVDDQGAVVDRLDELGVDAVLLTPAHQFPTGVALSAARRAAVVRWAERTGGIVIEDDYDGEFRFDRRAIGALQALAPQHVVYAGTASKALAPAIGLGWCVLPSALVEPVLEQRRLAGGATDAITQLALAAFIDAGGYDRTVRASRLRYRARREHVEEVLHERMPTARLIGMAAGLHSLLDLPDGVEEADVAERAASSGLRLEGLQTYWAGGTDEPSTRRPAMVVGFGAPPDARFEEAVGVAVAAIAAAALGAAG